MLTSLIATCKRHHIDPFAYLRDVFQRIAAHPKNQLADLLPDKWLAARISAVSCPRYFPLADPPALPTHGFAGRIR